MDALFYQKLKIIYTEHFKLVAFLNFGLSFFFGCLFFLKGFDKVGLYNLAVVNKGILYGLIVVIEKVFFVKRRYYFQNLGLSYRRLFSMFFIADFAAFMVMLFLFWLCRN